MALPTEVEVLIPALASMPVAAMVTDVRGVVCWANSAFSDLTAYTRDELAGQNVATIRSNGTDVLQGLARGEAYKCESVWVKRNGASCGVGEAMSPIRDPAGCVTHCLWVITDRFVGERESAVISAMAEGVTFQDAESRILLCNESAERILGLSFDQMSGRTSLDPRWAAIHEDGSSFPGETHPSMVTLRTGKPQSNVIMGVHKTEGSPTWISINSRLLVRDSATPYGVVTTFSDITEQKRLQDALRKSEREFSKAFLSSPVAMTVVSVEGGETGLILNANEAFEELTGYTREEALGHSTASLGLWLDPRQREEAIQQYRSHNRIRDLECRIRRKNGEVRTGLLSSDFAELGGRSVTVSTMIDITERKRSEDVLRQASEAVAKAEHRYRSLFNGVSDAVFVFKLEEDGLSSPFIDVNDNACGLSGYTREELLRMRIADIAPLEFHGVAAEVARRLSAKGKSLAESAVLARDGRRVPVEVNTQELELDGSTVMVSSVRDLTKRREAERKYRVIFEGAIEGIYRTTPAGIPLDVNPALARMLGFDSPQDYMDTVAHTDRLWIDPKDRLNLIEALKRQEAVIGYECQVKCKDGTPLWISFNCRIVPGADGTPQYIEGFVEDISDRKRAEAEKAKLEERLHQAQKLEGIGRLAGGVAHEFNNILTVINGYAGFLVEGLKAPDPLHAYAETIKSSGERAASLTRQLLAFSRKQTFRPRTVDLNAAIQEFALMLEPLIGETITLAVHLDGSLGHIIADPDQLHHVMMNLALNARDAMPEGGRLEIATTNVELGAVAPDVVPGSYVQMTVSDTGEGMNETVRRNIFEPFFTTKDVGEGTGLGLATVYGIVRQSDGWIEVQSEVGVGTCFKVYLPTADATAQPAEGGTVTRVEGGPETILLVEDQKAVRTFTKIALEELGYRVLEAADGNEAIAVAEGHRGTIQVLLTDVVLPGMNGRKVSERLLATRPDLKVIFMSGYPGDVIGQQGVLNESVAFVQKPYSPDELADKVRQVLRKS